MRFRQISALSAAIMLSLTPVGADATVASGTGVIGTWVNPKGSVKVQTGGCGDKLCGWVIWANPQATTDAHEAGIDKLIGITLLQDYHATGPGRWQGRVYVPDMGKTYYSTIRQLDPNSLKISGCILGGWICKSQTWQRG